MKKMFENHEVLFCIVLIIVYVLINSYCVQNFGMYDYKNAIINTTFSIVLIMLILLLNKTSYYGLKKVQKPQKYLYFIPLALIVSVNLWNGINIDNTINEIIFYILNMFNIGFIEEIIFRGFLFKMMEKNNVKNAKLVIAITFGTGHIVNLLNGNNLLPTIMQICYAISIGYLFVIIFFKSKSIIPCIVTHSLFNSLSVFNIENSSLFYVSSLFLIVVPVIYAVYINMTIKE